MGNEAPQRGCSRLVRWMLFGAGWLSLALAIVGILVPLLPTTPFLLLSAFCFFRSSKRIYRWLMAQPVLGPAIRCYRRYRAISLGTKIGSLILLWTSIGFAMIVVVSRWFVRLFLLAIAIGVTIHLLHLKTLSAEMRKAEAVPADRDTVDACAEG